MMPPDEIFENVRSAAAGLVTRAISPCKKTHHRHLAEFAANQRKYWERFEKSDEKAITLQTILLETEASLKNYLEWIKGLEYLDQHTPESLWAEWKEQFETWLKGFPSSQDVVIQDSFYDIRPEDGIKVRLWKRASQRRNRLRALQLKIKNRVRSLFRRPPLALPQDHRSVPVHPFLQYFVSLPIARLLLQEREQALRRVALQLQQLHRITELMIGEVLGSGAREDQPLSALSDDIRTRHRDIREKIPAVSQYLDDMDQFETKALERIQGRLEQLKAHLQGAWECAGTLVLPDRAFDDRTIQDRWTELERDLEKSRQAWQVHFEGEREDWTKDIELSLHQIRAVLICIDTVERLKETIEERVLPAVKEPGIMIAESLRKFQEAHLEEAEFKDMILTENRSMLLALRQHTLPALTDAVLQAQIDKTMENYLLRIKQSTEQLQDRHIILLRPDLERLRPSSKIMDISLKDLILEEFFSELSRKHSALTIDVDQRIQEILRDVSELDQIVEFNLEAALDLLQEREAPEPIQEARSVVTEGLERANGQIDDLAAKNKDVLQVSEKTLVRMTFEYIRQIQDLADNEKILELKLRVARATAKERFREYRDGFLRTAKGALPSILSFLSKHFKELQTGYFRLRQFTGLGPATEKVEEPLSEFIAAWQNQTAALPHVYQRLFRIEALTDDRFFEGRTEEMEALKGEYEAWRAGDYGVIALVGEKGSGRTTLLNFATQKFYTQWPCLTIQLKEVKPRTEKGLFTVLKAIYNKENIESLDELENAIPQEPGRKIVVVEDLQTLFIRTVDGFDLLERFLLFVSRTYKHIYWVITCSLYSWQYFDRVIQLSKYFKRTIYLGRLSKPEIEHIILKRHRVSGYKLFFEVPERVLATRKFRKQTSERELQDYCKNILFERLHELGEGNITVTMLFWLGAIKRIENDTLVLSPLIDFDYSALYGFSPDELFTLSALLQHEALNAEEHSEIFHQEIRQSLLLLNRLSNKGILVADRESAYKINPLLYRPVVETLKGKNILH